jgi:hypothetical protein
MMAWNYRVFREADGGLSIREVFYESDGQIVACGESVRLEAGSISELTTLLDELSEALALPILTPVDVPPPSGPKPAKGQRKLVSHREVLARLGLVGEPG